MELMLDLDGVLTDFCKAAYEFHGIEKELEPGNFDIVSQSGIKPKDFWEPLGHDFWANLPWMPDGIQILLMCEDIVGEENICLLTSPTWNTGSASGKLEWIQKNIPNYSRRFLIGPPKHFCCNKHRVLVDDGEHNIAKWDGPSILIPRIWNKNRDLPVFPYVEMEMFSIVKNHYERDLTEDFISQWRNQKHESNRKDKV